jgi:hypothetical protein
MNRAARIMHGPYLGEMMDRMDGGYPVAYRHTGPTVCAYCVETAPGSPRRRVDHVEE